MYNSGAITNKRFDYSNGLIIEADMYVSSNSAGCWLESSFGIARTMEYGDKKWPGEVVMIDYLYSGSSCWADPNKEGVLTCILQKTDGNYEKYKVEHLNNYLNGWHTYKIEILPDLHVNFYIDDKKIYHSNEIINSYYTNMPLVIGKRSSSYGDALIDNIKVLQVDKREGYEKLEFSHQITKETGYNTYCIVKDLEVIGNQALITVDFVQWITDHNEPSGRRIKNENPKLRYFLINENTILSAFSPFNGASREKNFNLVKLKKYFSTYKNRLWIVSTVDGVVTTLSEMYRP